VKKNVEHSLTFVNDCVYTPEGGYLDVVMCGICRSQ
jgi:hypothetical protein